MIDLHIHSTLSDGTLSPAEIMTAARTRGVTALSITDHDTMAAYPEAIRLGLDHGIEVVPGIEITAHHQDLSIHVLGLGLRHDSVPLTTGLKSIQEARQERNRRIIAKLNGYNLTITMDDLPQGNGQTGRPHIARILVQKRVVKSEQEAFARFLRKDGAAYVQRQLLPVEQAIAMINAAGGVAVLAHPGTLKLPDALLATLVRDLTALGLTGIEAYHPMNSEKMIQLSCKLCHGYGLIATGGSDFHGRQGDKAPLGEVGNRRKIPGQLLAALKARIADLHPLHGEELAPPPVTSALSTPDPSCTRS
jgi:hypothetical protein